MKPYLKVKADQGVMLALAYEVYCDGWKEVADFFRSINLADRENLWSLIVKLIQAEYDVSENDIGIEDIGELGITFDNSLNNPDSVIEEIYFDYDGIVYDFVVCHEGSNLAFYIYYPDTGTYALSKQE